jgi:hypothetical protein
MTALAAEEVDQPGPERRRVQHERLPDAFEEATDQLVISP